MGTPSKRSGQQFTDSDCTGTTLVPGVAYGVRRFALDSEGILRGVTYPYPWTPGVNEAKCLVADIDPNRTGGAPLTRFRVTSDMSNLHKWCIAGWGFDSGFATEPKLLDGWLHKPCGGLDPACSCGFYAYHSGGEAYGTRLGNAVTGIVECTGKVVLGPLGMRAEKARLVGVLVPHDRQTILERDMVETAIATMERERKLWHQRGWWSVTNGTVVLGVVAAVLAAAGTPLSLFASGVTLALAGWAEEIARENNRKRVRDIDGSLLGLRKRLDELPLRLVDLIEKTKANYPDVQFFETSEGLREAFPVESLAHLVVDE